MSKEHKGARYNAGKPRFGLIPTEGLEAVAWVYTKGAHKYSRYKDAEGNEIKGSDIPYEDVAKLGLTMTYDGAYNWRNGLGWSGMMESAKRHIQAWERGEDMDKELGTLHLANAAWGLLGLLTNYKIYPQGDDRKHGYLTYPKVGLDIDEVLADWLGSWMIKWNIERPKTWFFDRQIMEKFKTMREAGELDQFYLDLKPLVSPCDIPFEPHCYVTSRPVDTSISEQWLDQWGFPTKPVHTVKLNESKVEVIKSLGIDIFIDDRFDNFVELNRAGINCLLMDSAHNQRYDVGYKRIFNFEDFKNRFL